MTLIFTTVDPTFLSAFAMLVGGMVCWGTWPSAQKIARNWRSEFFHLDFSLGLFLISLLVIGNYRSIHPGAAFLEGLLDADRSAWLWALGGGALMNAGNLALLAAIRRVGITVAFPISVGLSLVVGTLLTYLVRPRGSSLFLTAGVALILCAVVANSLAYRHRETDASDKHRSINGLGICFVSGILFMCSGPMFAKAISSTKPLDPNETCVLYALGSLIVAGPLLIYLTRRPIGKESFSLIPYLYGSIRNHMAGLLGGAIWGAGMLLVFLPANTVGPALALAVGQADPLVAALWGVLIWGEFREAPASARNLLASMFVLYFAGLACLGLSYRTH